MVGILGLSAREIFLVLFVLGIAAFVYWDRKKVRRHFILFYRRTENGIEYIDRIAKAAPRFWKVYGWSAAIIGLISIPVALGLIGYTFFNMVDTRSLDQGPSLVLPGTTDQPQFQAGVSFIPAEYWVIGIAILMFVHEMSHGIIARSEGFEINSVGWVILGVIPGAFVEPKGEKMLPGADVDGSSEGSVTGMWEQGNWKSRLKVLGGGSFANYLTAGVFLLVSTAIVGAVSTSSGVIYNAQQGLPAAQAGMDNGTLYEIDGEKIDSLEDLKAVSNRLEINQTVNVRTNEGNFTLVTVDHPRKENTGYMGVRIGQTQVVKDQYEAQRGFLIWFTTLLSTVALLNFLIGIFNMLPIKPLDGGLMVETLITEFAAEKNLRFLHGFSLFGWTLLLGTIVLSLVVGSV